MPFQKLQLSSRILDAIHAAGYQKPTPIQERAIPVILTESDLLAIAQTGTGKTAAFALPILELLSRRRAPRPDQRPAPALPGASAITTSPIRPNPQHEDRPIRALILTPTRELASQIGDSFRTYGDGLPLRNTVIFGGVGQNPQVAAIRKGADIVIATPGRLLDLLQQRLIRLDRLEIFVLDEADRMLDMGFIHDVRKIIATIPAKRQTLFFSATMPPEISKLASQILTHPKKIEVTPVATTAERIAQSVHLVQENQKTSLLKKLLENHEVTRALVFTRTKRDANRVADSLLAAGFGAAAIHGNKSQGARERALDGIKSGKTLALVATDIAARGIDIDEISHVFNYDVPNVPETYVHRIGRTARAGREGVAVSFCSPQERGFLADIERLTRQRVSVVATPEGLEVESRKRGGGGGGRGHHGHHKPQGGHGQGQRHSRGGRRR